MTPPANAVVFAVDEKSQIQALQRAQPILPMDLGQPERQTSNYVRHGALDLFAALNVATGEVLARCTRQHRAQDFVAFLREVEASVDPTVDVHVVLDNLSAHKAPPRAAVARATSPRAVSLHADVRVVAQPRRTILWLADRAGPQARVAHEPSTIAGGHLGLRRRAQ